MNKIKKQELKETLAYAYFVSGLALSGHADMSKSIKAIKNKLFKADN